ncbi:membrane protein DedA, SNARE-associated domain [Paenibacillus algorifonticola]|uniref:Membrane protein DedA, SNARE-associated domain n=1 Tax=Paenibacillus algorifonticola TaxID=684063 RepID=A0A1I2E0L4_9BACL|nr:DedA family protein [Paenibacillus algorifonticola]SFE85790.1 membrane protein DedA, SNARE-associated domain [Paenibacillus algorifonticola]
MDRISEILHTLLLWIESLGYFGILIGLLMEVIPSEIVLGFGGYLVYKGEISYAGAVFFGTLGAVGQNWILYAFGRFGGRPLVEKYGKYIKIKKKHVDLAEEWFKKYGSGIVFTARFVPVMRQVISIPAGMAKMNFWLFTALTAAASLPWALLFVHLGRSLGENWENIHEQAKDYVLPAIILAVLLIIIYSLYKFRKSRKKSA